MTPADFRAARKSLGLSRAELARALGIACDRTIEKWEIGARRIPAPVAVLVDLLVSLPEARRRLCG